MTSGAIWIGSGVMTLFFILGLYVCSAPGSNNRHVTVVMGPCMGLVALVPIVTGLLTLTRPNRHRLTVDATNITMTLYMGKTVIPIADLTKVAVDESECNVLLHGQDMKLLGEVSSIFFDNLDEAKTFKEHLDALMAVKHPAAST